MRYFLYKQTNGKFWELYYSTESTYDDTYFSQGATEIELSEDIFLVISNLVGARFRDSMNSKKIKAQVHIFKTEEIGWK